MDRGVWWAVIHGVAKSHTRLSNAIRYICMTVSCISIYVAVFGGGQQTGDINSLYVTGIRRERMKQWLAKHLKFLFENTSLQNWRLSHFSSVASGWNPWCISGRPAQGFCPSEVCGFHQRAPGWTPFVKQEGRLVSASMCSDSQPSANSPTKVFPTRLSCRFRERRPWLTSF